MKKRIVLCADDYGQAPAISQGILALVKDKRLSAVSCMVTTPHWAEHAGWLKPFLGQIDIGLHFNLTEGKSSLLSIMLRAVLRWLNPVAVAAELNRQIDAFEQVMGCLPTFIDGHQHVHQFPVVREALIQVYEQRLQPYKPYIRVVDGVPARGELGLKKWVVRAISGQALKRRLVEKKIPFNQSFSGMYAFSAASNYARLFPEFLAQVGDGGLIMCHPGLLAVEADDPIAAARYKEYQYFSSDQFLEDSDYLCIFLYSTV